MANSIKTSIQNSKWRTLWKNRMENNKPLDGDYNFILWKKGGEVLIEMFNESDKPAVFINGQWNDIEDLYRSIEENS